MKYFIALAYIQVTLFTSLTQAKNAEVVSERRLPEIQQEDREKTSRLQNRLAQLIETLNLDTLNFDDLFFLEEQSLDANRAIDLSWVRRLVYPSHLKKFESKTLENRNDTFSNFLGVHGGCYQFRVFYKYNDSESKDVEWASSLLTVPPKNYRTMRSQSSVVLAPTFDGLDAFLEPGYWLKLCDKNIASLVPESLYKKRGEWVKEAFDPSPDPKGDKDYKVFERGLSRYVRLLEINSHLLKKIDTIQTDLQSPFSKLNVMPLNKDRVGLWGSSLGALAGTILMERDRDLKGAVLNVGGGDVPYILSKTKIKVIEEAKKEQMESLGLKSDSEYEDFLKGMISLDPLNSAYSVRPQKIFMTLAESDSYVPNHSQMKLWNAFDRPSHKVFKTGHVGTLLLLAWLPYGTTDRALDHLYENLVH